jgi:peptide/nickel transport system substrate-binding protein
MRACAWLVLLTLAGCRDRSSPDAGAPSAEAVQPTRDWLDGRLPADALVGEPVKGGTLTVRVAIEPAGLNRLHDQLVEGTMVQYTMATVYETLAELDRDTHPRYDLKPLLAQSWQDSDDHLTLTVHLRKGVRFHDGQTFTSRDVKAVMDTIVDPKNASRSLATYFSELDSVTTPDELTVVVKWKKPYFLATRTFLAGVPMMPASALKGDFDTLAINRAPIGTGPWKFEKWDTGRSVSFGRFDGYWGNKPWFDRIVVRFVKDSTVATQLWEQGEFDLMTRIEPAVWRSLETPSASNAWAIRGYHRLLTTQNNYSWLGWNETRPMFADVRVRRALGMLYPAKLAEQNIDMGLEPGTTCPYYRESESCDPSVQPLPYDPKAAARLLDEAGWKDTNGDGVRDQGGVPLKFTFVANAYSVKLAKLLPLLQEEYRKVGIDMDIEKVESASYLKRVRDRDFDACSLSWSNQDPIQDQFQVFHSSQAQAGSNFVSYKSPKVDALLEQIRAELDPNQRVQLERAVHRALYEDQVYTFLGNRPALDAVKVDIKGLKPSLVWYDLRKAWRAAK